VEHRISDVGVIDKAMVVLDAVERQPLALAALVKATGFSRATAHRLAVALEAHGLLRRDADGRFTPGARLIGLGRAAERSFPLGEAALPALRDLRDDTGESVQLYVREGDERVCVASLESPHGLRTIVATGAHLPLDLGSGGAALRPTPEVLRRGWVESVGEREPGVASVSVPVLDRAGVVVAAVSVSGPIERLTRSPGKRHATALLVAARRIEHDANLRTK
jgi:DNA-binding IclR family transcriptional regulator